MTIKKSDLAFKLSHKYPELEKEDLENIIEAFFEAIKDELKKGNKIELRDFGRFYISKGKGGFFYNPKNNQKYYIKEKIRVIFKPGKELKERINSPIFAGIDLGTQSFRLIFGKKYENKIYFLKTFKENVRLGEGLVNNNLNIQKEALERGINVLKNFKTLLDTYEIEKYRAIGTAVFRKAKNINEFITQAKKIGIDIEIISPEKEAFLTLEGVLFGIKEALKEIPKRLIIVDVGGGSTEITYLENEKVVWSKSIEIGAVFLKELFNLQYPLSLKSLNSLRSYINQALTIEKVPCDLIIITGGTASILGAIDLKLTQYIFERLHGHIITKERLQKIIEKIRTSSLDTIRKMKGMEKGREDIVLPGLLIYSEILNFFEKDKLFISEYGILEGTLLSLLKQV